MSEAIEFYGKAITLSPNYFLSMNNKNVAIGQQNNLKNTVSDKTKKLADSASTLKITLKSRKMLYLKQLHIIYLAFLIFKFFFEKT